MMACPALPLLLLILIGAAPSFARDFWNIDCGGTETFVKDNGLTFEGDALYIRTGVSRTAPDADRNGIPREIATLRAFPPTPWKKNCYRVPVERGTKVLVRTNFYYGNYDGLNSPPEFDVWFDTAKRCSVTTDSDLTSWSYCEVVYLTTKKNGTDICFVRTNNYQSPIVSSIEVRRLPSDMYGLLDFSSYALFNRRRFAFGANETIGYPNDAYNRDWVPNKLSVIVRTENTTAVVTTGLDGYPPALLFQTAVVAQTVKNQSAAKLTIPMPWLPTDPINIYFVMYFTEPVASDSTSAQKNRVFNVYVNRKLISNASDPIQPRNGLANEFPAILQDVTNETAFDLMPANGSTLPPAISGMEIYSITDIANATDTNDVETLSMLQRRFTEFENWTGDPCQPIDYNWEWVGCKNTDASPPRINKLLLRGYQLSGEIPDFSRLAALEVVDIGNNSFTGRVPEFLASLPNLQTLDLSDNDFDSIPDLLRNNNNITLITKGNSKLNAPAASPGGPSQASQVGGCNKINSSIFLLFILSLVTITMS